MEYPETYANISEAYAKEADASGRAHLASLAAAYATLALVAIELRNGR